MALFNNYEILVGTYEEYVMSYKVVAQVKPSHKFDLVPSFTVKAHLGPVRCLTSGAKFVISGGSDEQCKIFDMNKRVEHGVLDHHMGTVSCVSTHLPSNYLLSASDDNSISVVKLGTWQVEKTLYKHQAGVTALALHPTGKLAFSAAKDKKMITWNLVKARPAFISNIHGIAEMIVVSPDGSRYAVGLHRKIDIYSIETAGVEYSIELKSRPNCLVFLNNDTVVVGGESSRVEIHSLIEKKLMLSWECHETRVRSMLIMTDSGSDTSLLITASSCDHKLKLWDVSRVETGEVECVGEVDTGCRLTCLTIWHPGMKNKNINQKRKQTEENGNVTPSKKKIKIVEKESVNKITESITVEEEQNDTSAVKTKVKKKKKKSIEVAS